MAGRRPNIPANIQGRITKVFITNLPEKCSGKDLSEFIRGYGDIYDLYIARKRDKIGNRFGFVSFLDVKDKDDLVRKICCSKMGDFWLRANVARFSLEEGEIWQEPKKTNQGDVGMEGKAKGDTSGSQREGKAPMFYDGSRSFKDTFLGRREVGEGSKIVVVADKVNCYDTLHEKALLVRMIDLDALMNVYVIMNELCPGEGKIQFLGGLSVLVSFDNKETADSVLKKARDVVGRFSKVDTWVGQSYGFERFAWLKIKGIPLHLLNLEVIKTVGGVFGKIVHMPTRSEEDFNLAYDCVGILTDKCKKVAEEIVLSWRQRKYSVWVEEDNDECVKNIVV